MWSPSAERGSPPADSRGRIRVPPLRGGTAHGNHSAALSAEPLTTRTHHARLGTTGHEASGSRWEVHGAGSRPGRTRPKQDSPLAEVQGIEPLGPQCNPTPVLKTGEPTRRPDTSWDELTGASGARFQTGSLSKRCSKITVDEYRTTLHPESLDHRDGVRDRTRRACRRCCSCCCGSHSSD